MKRLILSILALAITTVFAQNVTFQVDMSEFTGSFTTPELNGTFNGWCGNCTPMTDANSDGIWEVTVDLSGQTDIEYKFSVDNWGDQETLTPGSPCTITSGNFTNRVYTVSGDETLDPVCWGSCVACGAAGSSSDITFSVNMSEYTGQAYTGVYLNGTFNGWCGSCTEMTDADNDMIYEVTVNVPNDTIEYKFTLDGWDVDEQFTAGMSCTKTDGAFTNRMLVPAGDSALAAVCWESCETCATASISEESIINAFAVSPNPSNGNVTVGFTGASNSELLIHDLTGKQVFSKNYPAGETNDFLQLNELQKGIYIVTLSTKGQQSHQRLVIQ